MPGEAVCRECEKPVKDVPRILFPMGSFKGIKQVCITCADGLQENHERFQPFAVRYRDSQRDPVMVLKDKVRDLTERLEMAQQTIKNLQPGHR